MQCVLGGRVRVCTRSLVRNKKGSVSLRGWLVLEDGDPAYKCVGTLKVAVLLGWTVGLIGKVTIE